MAKAIIFGANGQDGKYLIQLLKNAGVEVIPISRNASQVIGDVGDFDFVNEQLKKHSPEYIFHFAANSTTRHFALFENHNAISTGTINILEAVRLHCPSAKVFLAGSAMQFKNSGLPIDEDTPFEASSPYSVSRIHSVYAGRYYRSVFALKVYIGYFFNHDSPLRSEQHVNQKIARAALRIASGSTEKLELGNIDVKKEFNFAGDIVKAVWTMVNQEEVFEAVIGNGKAYSIKDFLIYCFNKVEKNWEDHVILKSDFIPEYTMLVSNPQVLKSLGWRDEVTFEKLADMMLKQGSVDIN